MRYFYTLCFTLAAVFLTLFAGCGGGPVLTPDAGIHPEGTHSTERKETSDSGFVPEFMREASATEQAGPEENNSPKDNQQPLKPLILGFSFPPLSGKEQREFTQRQAASDALNIRYMRYAEDWAFREPVKGKFHMTPFQERMEWAKKNKVSFFLTLQSNAPSWACDPKKKNAVSCVYKNNEDWKRYLDQLFALMKKENYPVHALQFGNEWQTGYWYKGDAKEFVLAHNTMVEKAKEHGLQAKIVIGGFSIGTLRVLAGCHKKLKGFYDDKKNYLEWGAANPEYDLARICESSLVQRGKAMIDSVMKEAKYQEIDLHLYDDVEKWNVYVDFFRERYPSKPIIVTEFGGPNLVWEQPYSDELQGKRLELYIKKLQELRIPIAYYFKLVQSDSAHFSHLESGLFRLVNGQPKKKEPAYNAFRRYSNPRK